jgi:2-methylcitrate dehydratase PrpD
MSAGPMPASEAPAMFDDRTGRETRDLASWSCATGFDDLPPHIVELSAALILDYLGVAIGGIDEDATTKALDVVRVLGGSQQATILGHGDRTNAVNAALVNGVASHVLDFDDTHIPTILHPTGPILSAGLAVAQLSAASGRELIRAHVVALEISTRASIAIFPEHYDAGWHMSGTTGTLAAAAAAALLLGAGPATLVTALGVAATQASGQREQFGAMTKSLHVGKAAANGVLAALLAGQGYTSAPDSLQGRRGMFAVMSSASRPEALVDGLGNAWEIERVGVKPYACGVVAHPPIDAARRLRSEAGVQPDEVEAIELRVNPLVVELTGKLQPRTGLEGKFSTVHCAAVAMIDGRAGPRQFTDEAVVRGDIVALRDRIRLHPDDSVSHSQAVAVARLRDGREVTVEVAAATGTPENRMSETELHAKFEDLVAPVLGDAGAATLLDLTTRLPKMDGVEPLIAATVRGARPGP